MSIRRFKSQEFYMTTNDPAILAAEYNAKTTFTDQGKELIQKYYQQKYATQLTLLAENLSLDDQLVEIKNSIDAIKIKEKNVENYRHTFVVQKKMGMTHAITIVYIKENGEEGILYADTLGENIQNVTQLNKLTGIHVYSVKENRQSSGYGCFTDAFVFSRDITGKNNASEYRIKNLLSKLKERAEPHQGYSNVKLPNELLKTAQTPQFILLHQNLKESNNPIYKNYTLAQFREKYTDKEVMIKPHKSNEPVKKDMANYMRVKGNKYADIIQMQYYLNEIALNISLSREVQQLFIKGAKQIFKSSYPNYVKEQFLFEYAESILNIQLIMRKENKNELCQQIALAANKEFFPILYEVIKEKISAQELFEYSIQQNNTEFLNALLNHNIIIPAQNYDEFENNELTFAIEKKSAMAVKLLLEKGADPNLPNTDLDTPFHLALISSRQNPEITRLLLAHGANPNLANSNGDTPLHLAVEKNIAHVDLLLSHPSIDPTIKNSQQKSAIDIASENKLTSYKNAAAKMRDIVSSKALKNQSLFKEEPHQQKEKADPTVTNTNQRTQKY